MEKEKKKMNKKLIAMLIIIGIVLIIGGATIGGIFGYNLIQKELLINEIHELTSDIDLTVDTIDTENIITSGDYGKVEKAIKTYLNNCGTEMQKMIVIMQDERMTNLLTIKNYQDDGPEFTESLNYIEESTKQLTESLETTVKLMEKEEIIKFIDNYNVGEKYKELYQQLMLDEETEIDLNESRAELDESIKELLNYLETSKETLNFLKQNKDQWNIENNLVMFANQELVDQYKELVNKLK